MKNAFYLILKALLVLKKRIDWKEKLNFKIYDVTTWLNNNCNTHIVQHLTKYRQPDNEIWLLRI